MSATTSAIEVERLFEQYYSAMFAYLYRMMGDRETAHDLAQETFLQVFGSRDRLGDIENKRAWIYRIATNLALNTRKRRGRFTWLPWKKVDDYQVHVRDSAPQIEENLAIEQALAALPPDYRAPLLLFNRYGFSVREIAAVLEISEGAVKTRLYRAREKFRTAYSEEN